jgi:ABC-type uncharacterized transport system permease subunit
MSSLSNALRLPTWRQAKIVTRIIAQQDTFNPRQVVSDSIILMARMGVLILLYTYVAQTRGGTIGSISVEAIGWTSFFYFVLYAFGTRWTARFIERDVKSGNISVYLKLPLNYIWQRIFGKVGAAATPVVGTVAAGTILLCTLYGAPFFLFDWFIWASIFATLILGFFLGFCINMCIGFTAFWLEDIQPVQNFFEKAAMVLGGAYVPVALFPLWMQNIATYTPFGLAYATTRVVSPNWAHEWQTVILAQLVWLGIAFAGMLWMYKKALMRVTVNGG